MDHVASPIPAPPDFPVAWERPEEARSFWARDRMHFPDPVTPLEGSALTTILGPGFRAPIAAYELPMRATFKIINNYMYQSFAPVPLPHEELEAMGKRSQEKVGALLGRLAEYWNTELLPEVQRHIAYWEGFNLRGATTSELVAHLDETIARGKRVWEIHFLIALPMMMAISLFDELYRDLFGAETAFDGLKLVQGFDNQTLQSGRALWRLSRRALTIPDVRRVLEREAAADVVPALEGSAAGRAFLTDLRTYLVEYGQRADKFVSWTQPTWIEDPTPVIKNLKDFVGQPDRDLEAEMAELGVERERLVAAARERLQGYPEQVVRQFEFLLKAAQEGQVLTEDHGYWIDFRSTSHVRAVLLECGWRLAAARAIPEPTDVFYLTIEEVRETLASPTPIDRRALIAERRTTFERFRGVTPPPVLGTEPPGPPPDDPMGRTLGKFFGGPPQPPAEPNTLRGNAGSPGVVRGRARLVRSLAEAAKLQRGDILVAETTAPPWTPLFATAAAVVTDTGGILSHCAVVAREYGIPAVVGTGFATAMVRDGQILEVDGNTGVVRIVAAA